MSESVRSDVIFLPLGGCGEIGMNFNLFGHADQWLAVDCGITLQQVPGASCNPSIPFKREYIGKTTGTQNHSKNNRLGL